MLVQLLLQHGCIVREALLPSEGISGQLFFPLVKGQLCPPVPLVLHDDKGQRDDIKMMMPEKMIIADTTSAAKARQVQGKSCVCRTACCKHRN